MIQPNRHAAIFPLPNLTLFPETSAAYHVFEKRYREMVASALEGDSQIAMALLKPGYEDEYYGNPEIYPLGCLGQISSYEELEDGNYNIVLQGLVRVGFGDLVQDYPYRVAELFPLPEQDRENAFDKERELLLARLEYLAQHSEEEVDFGPILSNYESFQHLLNLVAKTLPLSPARQYELFAMDALRDRAAKVLWYLDDHIDTIELLKKIDPLTSDDISLN